MLTLTPHPPLRPRTVPYEPTLEQQQQAYARAERRALHWQLHNLFLTETPESAFDGKMNLPPERSESEIGCELTSAFVGWLMTHTIPEHAEMQRRRVLFAILQRLAREQPDLSLIVLEHSRTHAPFRVLAKRFGIGNDLVSAGYAEALTLMLKWLAQKT